jgi:YVTN family beta-propeller protein
MRKFYLPLVLALFVVAILFVPGVMRAQTTGFPYPPPASLVATIPLDGQPKGIAVNPATNQIYVALFDTSRVARIDGATNAVTGSHDTGGLHPNQIAFNPTNARLYVTNRDSNELSFMDSTTLNVIAKYRVGSQPWGVAVDPVSSEVYVDNFGSASVSLLNGTNGALIKTFTHPSMWRPSLAAYSVGMRRLYTLDWETGSFFVIDANRQLYSPFNFGYGMFGITAEVGTERVIFTIRTDGTTRASDGSVSDPTKMMVQYHYVLPGNQYALTVNPNTHHVFVVAVYNGRQVLYVLNSLTFEWLQLIDLGTPDEKEGGQGVAVNTATNRVYISNYADRTVYVLQDSIDQPTATPSATQGVPPTDTSPATMTASPTPTEVIPPTNTPTVMPTEVAPPTLTATPTASATTPPSALPYVLTTFAVGTHPKSVAINELRRWYGMVALFDASQLVSFDVSEFRVSSVGTYTQGMHPNQILYASGNRLLITNRDSNNFVSLPWIGPGEPCWAPTGELPWGIADANSRVYIGNFGSKNWGGISIFNQQCLNLGTIPLPNDRPAFLRASSGKVYVAGWVQGNLYVIDSNNNVRNPINVGPGAFGLAAHMLSPRVYLTNRNTGRLYIIDTNHDNVVGVVTLPGKGYALAVNYKTNHLFVVDAVNDRVYVLDAFTGALLTTLPVGHQDADDGGQGIVVSHDTDRVFVANYADGTITVIQDVNTPAMASAEANTCPAPQLASWPNNATIPYRHVTLDWADPACATRYEIQIRRDSPQGKLVASSTQVPISQYTTTKALGRGKTFVWRVRACSESTCGKWSGWWKFTVAKDAQ